MSSREEARDYCVKLMEQWELDLPTELPGGFCSHVVTDGLRVLKVPFQGEEQTTGLLAARRLSGVVGPVIHRIDEQTGSLLMDFVSGVQLSIHGLHDHAAIPVFANLVSKIRGLEARGFPDLDQYFENRTDLIDMLLSTTSSKVFLHADLHHLNILGMDGAWFAIDPLGFYGDPAFEAVAFVRNPIDSLGSLTKMEPFLEKRIVSIAGHLDVDPCRVFGWTLADRRAGTEDADHAWGRMRVAIENLKNRFGFSAYGLA